MIALLMAAAIFTSDPIIEPISLGQDQLDAISARCQSPKRWLRNIHGLIHIRPSRAAKYEQVDCLLAELKRHHAGPMGFVGNEAPH